MARGRKKRTLSAEERALWEDLSKTLTNLRSPEPLPPQPPAIKPTVSPRSKPTKPEARLDRLAVFADRSLQAPLTRYSPAPSPAEAPGVSQLDRKTMAKLRTGRERPQARLDLHGMFLSEAHDALFGFIRRSHAEGKRMVLVITGKGRAAEDALALAPHRRGVLRHALPQWLASPGLAPLVLRVSPAQQRDGGGGAWYVWLRRSGK